ncbi:MAG: serine/threonine-protein kinase [Dehalococcoidia bacterium]
MQGSILSNRYLIAEEIGIGGMGSVYRATDLRTGGEVAVKVPHTFLARNVEYMERLRREAQIAASVYSPRVVRVVDFYEHEGVPYLVMEYVPGETLADIARQQGRFSLAETLAVGLEVARALDAAHAKGVIHRDLKPQNIKLVDGEVKVLDFGIAKGEGFANVTSASVFMGTPEYCAPERGAGEGDIRSDIYSLGVILYEMYEGHLPFQAATPLALMKKHETEPAPPLTGDVPEAFQEIIARCLAKDPDERYQTPRELVQALRKVADLPSGTIPTEVSADGLVRTIIQPRLTDSSEVAQATSTPVAEPPSGQTTLAASATAAVEPATQPHRRNQRLLPLLGIVAAVLIGGAIAAVVLLNRDGGDETQANTGAFTDGTAAAVVTSAAATAGPQSATPRSGDAPIGPPLLAPGEEKQLVNAGRVEWDLTPNGCPGVKTVLQPRTIKAETSGRVVVSYTVEIPRVEGVECVVDYPSDAASGIMVLQTRKATGTSTQVQNSGGSGVAQTGARDIYGIEPVQGEWWWDSGVDLNGEELTLLRIPPGSDVPLFRLPLLRR